MIGNEPAFPFILDVDKRLNSDSGLTIRQYFVAQAMIGLLASEGENFYKTQNLAEKAVTVSDACLAREAETRK